MRTIKIGLIGLALLGVPGVAAANANMTLVPKIKPIARSYPGVKANILGVTTDMTVSQVEAIAAKSYPAKPEIGRSQAGNFRYLGDRGFAGGLPTDRESQPYVYRVLYTGKHSQFGAYFTTPVMGNVSFSVGLAQGFYNHFNSISPAEPLVSVEEQKLIKKYGPPSLVYQDTMWWAFSRHGLIKCPNGLRSPAPACDYPASGATSPALIANDCGLVKDGVEFFIQANFETNNSDHTRVVDMSTLIEDARMSVINDAETKTQLRNAAIAAYDKDPSNYSPNGKPWPSKPATSYSNMLCK